MKKYRYNLNDLRLKKLEQNVIKGVTVQKFPSNNNAAKYHSLRVYYQVHVWLENETQSNRLGWGINQ